MSRKNLVCTGHAFVCFQKERDKLKVVRHFNNVFNCFGKQRYRNSSITVTAATDPDDIIYENFEYKWYHKLWRRLIGVAVTIACILFATGSAAGLEKYRLTLGENTSLATALQTWQFKYEILINFAITITMNIVSLVCSKILIAMSSFEKHKYETGRRKSLYYKLCFSRLLIELFTIGATMTFRVNSYNKLLCKFSFRFFY